MIFAIVALALAAGLAVWLIAGPLGIKGKRAADERARSASIKFRDAGDW